MENITINKKEKIGSTAIQQSLRFEFRLTYKEIAEICKVSSHTVWNNCNGQYGVLRWEDRTRQKECCEIAYKMLWRSRLTEEVH